MVKVKVIGKALGLLNVTGNDRLPPSVIDASPIVTVGALSLSFMVPSP